MTRWRRLAALALGASAILGTAGCALAAGDGSGGGGDGGGFEVRYCEQDHRGDLNEARCYDEPDGDR
jgi:hypothetical protein